MASIENIKSQLSLKNNHLPEVEWNIGLYLSLDEIGKLGFWFCSACLGRGDGCKDQDISDEFPAIPNFIEIQYVGSDNHFCLIPSNIEEDDSIKSFIDFFEARDIEVIMTMIVWKCP